MEPLGSPYRSFVIFGAISLGLLVLLVVAVLALGAGSLLPFNYPGFDTK